MSKSILFLIWLLFSYGLTFGQDNTHKINLINEFINSDFRIYKTKEHIPKSFFKQINHKRKGKLIMVNPGEDYNTTDMWVKKAPNSRLVLLCISEESLYALLYDVGGYGVSRKLFLFKKAGKEYQVEDYYVNSSINTIQDLKDYLISNH